MKAGGPSGRFILALVVMILPDAAAAETIAVYASAKVEPLARALVTQFNRANTDRATLEVRPSAAGVHALTARAATIAIVDRPAWEAERRPHRVTFGTEPRALRIALKRPERGRTPAAVYVSTANPMTQITRSDLARIFVTGNPDGDVGRWDQLRLAGRYAGRRIHLYGGRDDGGFATNLRLTLFAGRQFRSSYEALDSDRAAVAAVRDDPFGIAVADNLPSAEVAGVKRLELRDDTANGLPVAADPLAPLVLAYVTPRGIDPATRRFVQFLLSTDGQQVVGQTTGYAPLAAPALTAERMVAEEADHEPR